MSQKQFGIMTYSDGDEDNQTLLVVEDYELGSFDLGKYWKLISQPSISESGLKLIVNGEGIEYTDLVAGPLSLTIVSTRFGKALQERCNKSIELIQAPLFLKNGQAILGFFIVFLKKNLIVLIEKKQFFRMTL